MGRARKYSDDEEAMKAKKEQIKKSNQKYQQQRKDFREKAFNEQPLLVKLLNKHVVTDKEWLTELLRVVMEMTQPEPKEKDPKEKKKKSKKVKKEEEDTKEEDAKEAIDTFLE
jgi:hypothetical protein